MKSDSKSNHFTGGGGGGGGRDFAVAPAAEDLHQGDWVARNWWIWRKVGNFFVHGKQKQ
jgi:hypothetical protein